MLSLLWPIFSAFLLACHVVHAAHDSLATCLLVPLQEDILYRGALTSNSIGKLVLYFDSTGVEAPRLKGTLPANLGVDADNPKGIHIHQYGDLRSASSLGSHFAGNDTWNHALPDTIPRHVGDMGNINQLEVDLNGTTRLLWTLDDNEERGVLGRSLVVHEGTDDGTSTSGNSGTPKYICALGLGNPSHIPDLTENVAKPSVPSIKKAIAEIIPTSGDWQTLYGRVMFEQLEGRVRVTSTICGLEDGNHGFHIHQYGDLLGENRGESVGDHFSEIADAPHALPHHKPRHTGDMGNIGSRKYKAVFEEEFDNMNLSTIIGRSVIIHKFNDNGDQPSGNAGAKIAVGVIGIAPDNLNPKEASSELLCRLDDTSNTVLKWLLIVCLLIFFCCIISCCGFLSTFAIGRYIKDKYISSMSEESSYNVKYREMNEGLLSKDMNNNEDDELVDTDRNLYPL